MVTKAGRKTGETFVKALMKRRMLLPIDHVSRRARKEMYRLAKQNRGYPLFASHSRPDAVMHPGEQVGSFGSHEYMLTNRELTYIRDTGGMVGLRAGDSAMREIPGCINKRLTCWGSAESLAQNVCGFAKLGLAVSMGSDFFGPVTMTAPRFAHDNALTHRWDYLPAACPRNVDLGFVTPFGYPAKYKAYKPKTLKVGHRDYRVRGLAHSGLMPDVIQEMTALGAPIKAVRMADSAERVLRMWQRAYPGERQGVLTKAQYEKLMGTRAQTYKRTLKPRPYNRNLRDKFIKCMKQRRAGSKKCDSLADWDRSVRKADRKAKKEEKKLKRKIRKTPKKTKGVGKREKRKAKRAGKKAKRKTRKARKKAERKKRKAGKKAKGKKRKAGKKAKGEKRKAGNKTERKKRKAGKKAKGQKRKTVRKTGR